MISVDRILDTFRDKIVADAWLGDLSMERTDLRKAELPTPSRNQTPTKTDKVASFSVEFGSQDRTLDVSYGHLDVVASFKKLEHAELFAKNTVESLHNYTFSSANLTIYACWYTGGPPVPEYNEQTASWEAVMQFEIRVG